MRKSIGYSCSFTQPLLYRSVCQVGLTKIYFQIRPACIPLDTRQSYVGSTAYVTGWGRLYSDNGPYPEILQEAALKVKIKSNTSVDFCYSLLLFNPMGSAADWTEPSLFLTSIHVLARTKITACKKVLEFIRLITAAEACEDVEWGYLDFF